MYSNYSMRPFHGEGVRQVKVLSFISQLYFTLFNSTCLMDETVELFVIMYRHHSILINTI